MLMGVVGTSHVVVHVHHYVVPRIGHFGQFDLLRPGFSLGVVAAHLIWYGIREHPRQPGYYTDIYPMILREAAEFLISALPWIEHHDDITMGIASFLWQVTRKKDFF